MSEEDDEAYMFRQAPYIPGNGSFFDRDRAMFMHSLRNTDNFTGYNSAKLIYTFGIGTNDNRTMLIPQGNETQQIPRSAQVYISRHSDFGRRPSNARLLLFTLLMLTSALVVVGFAFWWMFVR